MTDDPVCSTSGRSEPARFNGGATTGSLAVGRKLQPKRFVRQQVRAAIVDETLSLLNDLRNLVLQIPTDVLLNEDLNSAIAVLPANYSFEVTNATAARGHPEPACKQTHTHVLLSELINAAIT